MKTMILAAVIATAALTAPAALAAERPPFGPPSEPTVFGHRLGPAQGGVVRRLQTVRRTWEIGAPEASTARRPSEPTIWGHRLPGSSRETVGDE